MGHNGFTIGDVLTLVGMTTAVILVLGKLLLSIRDTLRDLKFAIGTLDPPTGLVGEIAEIKHDHAKTNDRVEEQREWIIAAGLHDRRSGEEHRQRQRRQEREHLTVRKQGL